MRSIDLAAQLTSVDGVGDIDVVGQRDVLDLNAGLLARFFGFACTYYPHRTPHRSVVLYPALGLCDLSSMSRGSPSMIACLFFDASHDSLPGLPRLLLRPDHSLYSVLLTA